MRESARAGRADAAPRAARSHPQLPIWDRPWAVLLLPAMAIGVAGLFLYTRFGMPTVCGTIPGCDQRRVELGDWMLDWLPLLIYLATLVVTIVLWWRGRPVVWLLLLSILVTMIVFVVGSLFARALL